MTKAYKLDCPMCNAGNCTDGLHIAYRQAEAQRDEAVAFREWVAEYAKEWREEEYGPTGEDLRHFVKQLHTKLASLTEECEHGCTIDATGQHHPGCARVIALAEHE